MYTSSVAEPVEVLVIEDVSVASPSGTPGSVIVSTEQMIIGRDGSIAVTIVVFDGSLSNELVRLNLDCALGTSIKFTKHQRECLLLVDVIETLYYQGYTTNVTPIIRTHNILTAHNRTHNILTAHNRTHNILTAHN
jgi:hypothetical protein